MAGRKHQGIADDASAYADLPEVNADGKSKGGIADDADLFEGLLEESSEAARSLQSNWLYQRDGIVFGPVKPKDLLEMLYKGEINSDTVVAVEEEDFRPLRLYGVFRAHLAKAKAKQEEIETEKALQKASDRRHTVRRIGLVVTAGLLFAGLSTGLVLYIRDYRERKAQADAAAKEDVIKKELAGLFDTVTIEPPLAPLVEEDEEDAKEAKDTTPGKKKKYRRRGGRGVVRFSGTGELQREEIMSGVASVFSGFKRCIVEQMQKEPETVPEEIILSFSINNAGRAQDMTLTDRTLRKSPMQGCMAGQLAKVKWRPFKGEVQNIEYYPIRVGRR